MVDLMDRANKVRELAKENDISVIVESDDYINILMEYGNSIGSILKGIKVRVIGVVEYIKKNEFNGEIIRIKIKTTNGNHSVDIDSADILNINLGDQVDWECEYKGYKLREQLKFLGKI